ncbi:MULTISPECIES: hypothetical protein [Lactobacillales]|uniref:hypothetical protein n=1 Tax=Lactobacillales TaxID=186826 RepID=UPI000B9C7139|nr:MULTISPECIES: hypothetical protein [Lactobacillales]OXT10036.1 hypothetical protein CBI42_11380 [Streptococcus sp. KR]PAK82472.1 hypothetical protein B8W85_08195 [Lentilactobacillus kefiri]
MADINITAIKQALKLPLSMTSDDDLIKNIVAGHEYKLLRSVTSDPTVTYDSLKQKYPILDVLLMRDVIAEYNRKFDSNFVVSDDPDYDEILKSLKDREYYGNGTDTGDDKNANVQKSSGT